MNKLLHQIITDIIYVGLAMYILSYFNILHNCYKWYVRYTIEGVSFYKKVYDNYVKRINMHGKIIIFLFIVKLIFEHHV